MSAKSRGAFMRWYCSRERAFLVRCHGGEGRLYRVHPVPLLLPGIEKKGQLEFDF